MHFVYKSNIRVLWIIKATEGTPQSDDHPFQGTAKPVHPPPVMDRHLSLFLIHGLQKQSRPYPPHTKDRYPSPFLTHSLQKQLHPYPTPVKNRTDAHLCSSHGLQKQLCPASQVLLMNNHIFHTLKLTQTPISIPHTRSMKTIVSS